MKSLVLLTLLFSLSNSSFAAHVMGAESHGGGAFVCRDSNGQISTLPAGTTTPEAYSVEIQDLWEGINFSGFPIVRDESSPWQHQLDTATTKFLEWQPNLATKLNDTLPYISSHMVNISSGVVIAAPHDANSIYVKPHCPLEGVASFDDASGNLLLDPTIVAAMHPTDYAALMFHESVYKVLRDLGDQDSTRARHFTAFVFSQAHVWPQWQGVPQDASTLYCKTSDSHFTFALFKEDTKLFIQFGLVDGYPTADVVRGEIVPRMQPPEPLLQQLYEKRSNQDLLMGIELGLNNLNVANEEVLQIHSAYETLAFVVGQTPSLLSVSCQNSPF